VSEGSLRAVRALPGALPDGEQVLWQGAPVWRAVFRQVMHGRKLAAYFALLLALRAGFVVADGGSAADAVVAVLWLVPPVLLALGVAVLLAWLVQRTTWYTVTNRRVVMRIGIVLEITCNFPFKAIDSAGLRLHADGTGDIPLVFPEGAEIAYAHLWPHARPWHFRHTVPMLRCVPDAANVAALLARAIAAASGGNVVPIRNVEPVRAPATSGGPTATAGVAG
jgi:fumarate reductase subunit C